MLLTLMIYTVLGNIFICHVMHNNIITILFIILISYRLCCFGWGIEWWFAMRVSTSLGLLLDLLCYYLFYGSYLWHRTYLSKIIYVIIFFGGFDNSNGPDVLENTWHVKDSIFVSCNKLMINLRNVLQWKIRSVALKD